MTYEARWKKGTRAKVPASVAVDELERLAKEREGPLSPQDIVDESRPEDALLHAQFEWNNGVAAEKWRCHEARQTINSLVYVEVGLDDLDPIEHGPVFVSVVVETGEQGYVPTKVVMQSADLKGQAIHEALQVLRGWRRRHANLKELSGLFSAIDQELERVGSKVT